MANKKTRIERLKNKLANGNLSFEEAQGVAGQIRDLGGKVAIKNFGYEPGKTGTALPGDRPVFDTDSPTADQVVYQTGEIGRKDPGSAMEAEIAAEDFNANKTIGYNNPNTNTSFGSSEVTRDENGNLVYNQKLSEDQQAILDAQEGLTQTATGFVGDRMGGFGSNFDPNLSSRSMQGDLLDDRARIEEELYGRLTKNLERDRGRELEEAKQTLYNQGIPYSDDPESKYQKMLGDIQTRYDTRAADARGQAVQFGGDEFLRQFGAQEQLRANELSEQAGIRGTNLGELGTLQGFGSGLMLPNLPSYQGPGQYNPYSPYDVWLGMQGNLQNWKGVQQGQQQINIAQQAANRPAYSPPAAAAPQQPAGPPIVAPPGL